MTGQFAFEMPTPTYPGTDRQPPVAGTQLVSHDKMPPRAEGYDSIRSPEADLLDMVAHLQLEVEELKFVQSGPKLARKTLLVQSKPVAFTSTKVPEFSGVTS